MRKIKLFVIAVLALLSFNLHADAKAIKSIKEYKLTSLSYVKKVCKITGTYKCEDFDIYKLDGGNGVLYISGDNKLKECVLVKDGELYGRVFRNYKGRTLTYNLHDKECSIKGVKATEEEIIQLTLVSFEALTSFADKHILNKTTN